MSTNTDDRRTVVSARQDATSFDLKPPRALGKAPPTEESARWRCPVSAMTR